MDGILPDWLEFEVIGNSVSAWITGAVIFVAALLLLLFGRGFVTGRLALLARRTRLSHLTILEQVASRTKGWFLVLIAFAVASSFWTIAPRISVWIGNVLTIGILLQAGVWLTAGFGESLRLRRDRELSTRPESVAVLDVLGFVIKLAVWSIVILVILDNLGVKITAMVAGLGVGGVAVALATQNILGDLFASLSIVLDKPFVVGDFLVIDDLNGSVEKVGLKTTRIRSLSGEQLIFSNNDLLNSCIRNFGRMFERRVDFSIGVT